MWTYLANILSKYGEKHPEKIDELPFSEINYFVFNILGKKHKLCFWDGSRDLFSDLSHLKKLDVLNLHGDEGVESKTNAFGETYFEFPVNDKDLFENLIIEIDDNKKSKLRQITKIVENSSKVTDVKLIEEYNKRINRAIETT